MVKQCQNCKQQFTIEPDDLTFYQKISVPPPTFCPECRVQRRFSWRNERALYRNKCAKTGESLISGFAPDSRVIVYERDLWWSDKWDPLSYGIDYDFYKSFFEQFNDLFHKVPMPSVFNARTVNCSYTQHTGNYKNAYLVFASWEGENISYGARCINSKDCMDVFVVGNCEHCYETTEATKSYKTRFSQRIENCSDSYFLFNCKGCNNCFGCTNLRNKSYYIFNEPHSKEGYFKKLKEFNLGSHKELSKMKEKYAEIKRNSLHKYANINNSEKSIGDNISNAYNCKECFDIPGDVRDCKFITNAAAQLHDSYDGYGVGASAELLYEIFDSGVQGSRLCFGGIIYGGSNIYYSYNCHNCHDCFGCIGLRKKQYCILNKQYSKKEYEKMVLRIIEHMNSTPYTDSKGREYRYGEFFPPELSPFAYNETVAQEYLPLTKEKALEKGYRWKEPEDKNYKITMKTDDLPDHIKDIENSIVNEVIQCAHSPISGRRTSRDDPRKINEKEDQRISALCNHNCTTAFKIIPGELEFYKKMNLPLPRLCPNCRHYGRLKQRNPLKLWYRRCMCGGTKSQNEIYENTTPHSHGDKPCPNEFETTYAPDREETVYCEGCYNAEVA